MPVLPYFINKGKRNKFKVPTKHPFSALRPSRNPLESSEIIDIHDSTAPRPTEEEDKEFASRSILDLESDERRVYYEPLDLHISPEPLMSSFPPGFLKNSFIHPTDADLPRIRDRNSQRGVEGGRADNAKIGFDVGDEDAEELIAKLQGMDASSFVGIPSPSGSPALISHSNFNIASSRKKATRKAAVIPVKIQTSTDDEFGAPHDNDDDGTDLPQSYSRSSSPASSAVSGTTLARALISNTFVLSIDTRDARKYRSGASTFTTLTRTDSATLPMGDNPFTRDRRFSEEGAPPWATNPEDIPPVPPMPSEAELLILASKASPPSAMYWRKTSDFRRNSSTGSLDSTKSREISAPVASSGFPITALIDSVSTGSVQASRRISEAANSVPRTPVPQGEDGSEVVHRNKLTSLMRGPSPSLPLQSDETAKFEGESKPLPSLPERPEASDQAEEASLGGFDNVIDYYSTLSPGVTQRGFKPAFSPISEVSESSGTSSPHKKRYSQRSSMPSPITTSPLSTRHKPIHGELSRTVSESRNHAHLPFRERPYPLLGSARSSSGPSRSHRSSVSLSFTSSDIFGARLMGKRKRSGSAPAPIVIAGDPQDLNGYRITMSPGNAAGSLIGDGVTQTFPETPSLYSPVWTPGTSSSIQQQLYQELETQLPPFPHTPLSATVPYGNMQTSLTQTMFMMRAASSAMHSRQSSVTRNRDISGTNGREGSPTHERGGIKKEDVSTASSELQDQPTGMSGLREDPVTGSGSSSLVRYYTDSNHSHPSPVDDRSKRRSPVDSISTSYSRSVDRPDYQQEPSPIASGSNSTQEHLSNSGNISYSGDVSRSPSGRSAQDTRHPLESVGTSSTQYVRTTRVSLASSNPDLPFVPSSPLHPSLSRHLENTSDSPPPYDMILNDRVANPDHTTCTPGFDFPQAYEYSPRSTLTSWSHESLGQGALNGRRQRQRPPLPAGPRDRRDRGTGSRPARVRNGSVSSVTSTLLSAPSRAPTLVVHSPRFNVPSPKFKGLTLEAAKWTFTSAELQAIVSRAIQRSAEALSIRLLRLETLDNDIPEDLSRLEAERRAIQIKYKTTSHRRINLLESLSNSPNSQPVDRDSTFHTIEALKDVSGQLDQLTESLHSVDEQIACLNTLVLKHSGSALAMALRKLNKSFLEKLAELELAKNDIARLGAERDEALKQAEEALHKANSVNSGVSRKPSARRFKPNLHSASRRSSYNSIMSGSSYHVSGARSPFILEGVPPVPAIPQSGFFRIHTDIPMRSANQPLSTSGITPSSPDPRALIEQEALYSDIEKRMDARLRRSRSFTTFSNGDDPNRLPTSPTIRRKLSYRSRRASLPGDFRLSEAYKAMNADGNAMLLTLRMLSDAP
ncbi:hypothetical protein AX15_000949 [Amanita polypyramis BW_CC]|nr:hypothetical protein AX15_000949 [Amanita polypyramis BW_CC]